MEKYAGDKRVVMTLDAGGTKFAFSAIQSGVEIVKPIALPSEPSNLEACLDNLVKGFTLVRDALPTPPVAISFAFPGPADYAAGIIGDLPNMPCFRGGVALKAFLEDTFKIPVFINNDGSLFAYGEAFAGVLPLINQQLRDLGKTKEYHNLLGVTLGTGFGAGVVVERFLLRGDNMAGGHIWCFSNPKYPGYIVEESVSIRAIKRVYKEISGDTADRSPQEIFEIAEGNRIGHSQAAVMAFSEMGEVAAEAIASALNIVDGILVIGGGLSGASKYIVPSILKVLKGTIKTMDGSVFGRLQMNVFDLDNPEDFKRFAEGSVTKINVPRSDRKIDYDPMKRIGVMLSKRGTSGSIAMGAYLYALNQL